MSLLGPFAHPVHVTRTAPGTLYLDSPEIEHHTVGWKILAAGLYRVTARITLDPLPEVESAQLILARAPGDGFSGISYFSGATTSDLNLPSPTLLTLDIVIPLNLDDDLELWVIGSGSTSSTSLAAMSSYLQIDRIA